MNRLLLLTNCLLICMVMVSCTPKNKKLPSENKIEETMGDDKKPPRSIEHNSPEKEKIDSVKAAKLEQREKMKGK